jgi:APA family basic amino acid/polyamine antiporter
MVDRLGQGKRRATKVVDQVVNWNTVRFLALVPPSVRPSRHLAYSIMSVSSTPERPRTSQRGPDSQSSPESRLLRAVGTWGLAASIVNITIGGGIFRLPAGVYSRLHGASPIAYLVCVIVMALVVMCFAEAGSRVSLTGGLYAYVEVAFGPLVGFIAGALLWAGLTAATAAVATFFGEAMAALVPALGSPPMRFAVITTALAVLAVLNVLGVANAARFNTIMTMAKLAPLAVVIVAGLASLHADRLAIGRASVSDIGRGSIFLIFAFLGVEAALVPSGEVRAPARTVPRAIAIALAVVAVVYLSVQIVAQSALGPALADSRTPVADAAGTLLGPSGRTLILVGSALSMFGYVSGMTLSVPRMLFAFGRDGFLFTGLSAVHPRFRTPHVAIATQTVINIALATTGTFEQLAIVANGAILIVYALCALAVFALRRKGVESAESPYIAPLGGTVPALAFIAVVWLLTSLTGNEWVALGITAVTAAVVFTVTRGARARRTPS